VKRKILAVDDEPQMLRLLERIVTEKTTYKITTTSNSLEVPAILSRNEYALVLCDLRMPGMDGMDVLRYVRENNRPEQVVIMTAFGSHELAIKAMQEGVFDYITKPFRKEYIILTIERAMRFFDCQLRAERFTRIVETEPYENSRKRFLTAYVQHLAERHNSDIETMAEKSGLDKTELEKIMTMLAMSAPEERRFDRDD
jgi:CheY-like chemotaxis protein